MKWLKQLFCKHSWKHKYVSVGCYDMEEWFECTRCKKQRESGK